MEMKSQLKAWRSDLDLRTNKKYSVERIVSWRTAMAAGGKFKDDRLLTASAKMGDAARITCSAHTGKAISI